MRLLRKTINFKFLSDIASGTLAKTTNWGFEIKDQNSDIKSAQWGIVEQIGPDVTQLKVGDYIFIDALQWTNKVTHNEHSYWKTTEPHVLLVSHTKPNIL